MKTTLRQQVDLINEINKQSSTPSKVKLLRAFLIDNGYEKIEDCKHYTLVRVTGKCSTCGAPVAEPTPGNSEEALEALCARLRARLRG